MVIATQGLVHSPGCSRSAATRSAQLNEVSFAPALVPWRGPATSGARAACRASSRASGASERPSWPDSSGLPSRPDARRFVSRRTSLPMLVTWIAIPVPAKWRNQCFSGFRVSLDEPLEMAEPNPPIVPSNRLISWTYRVAELSVHSQSLRSHQLPQNGKECLDETDERPSNLSLVGTGRGTHRSSRQVTEEVHPKSH